MACDERSREIACREAVFGQVAGGVFRRRLVYSEYMKKVLLVEDDVLFSSILAKKLRAADFEVGAAFDGGESIESAHSFGPDIILLDLLLPVKDGFAVIEALKASAQTAHIPILIISNLGSAADIYRAKRSGVTDYLVKASTTPAEVVAKTREMLGIEISV
jgi:DNA-binding response OmpR family regulator